MILMKMPTDRKVHSNDVDGGPNEDGYLLEGSTFFGIFQRSELFKLSR